jgi:hypothetical protein
MDSQVIKLGRPSTSKPGNLRPGKPGELRLGRKVVAASTEQPRSTVVSKVPDRTSTMMEEKSREPQVKKQVDKRGYSIGVNNRPEAGQAAAG